MALFSIENLTFSYPGAAKPALKDLSLDIPAGSYVVLCGRSGCGKTTLLRHLKSVLTPHGSAEGRVLFDGRPLGEVEAREQAAHIGFVLQNPDAQIVTDKVWHELAFGLENLGCDPETMRLRVAEMASYFGIQHWFHRDVAQLSGGQKQLLNLAAVMAMQPDVLVLDEPTAQLDPIAASDFLATVLKINRELGTTVLIAEHRLEEAFPHADVVALMEEGAIAIAGSPREVGERLQESHDPMVAALPAPLRIWGAVERRPVEGWPGDPSGVGLSDESLGGGLSGESLDAASASAGPVGVGPLGDGRLSTAPLTVRGGRMWLGDWCRGRQLPVRAIPEMAGETGAMRPAAAEMGQSNAAGVIRPVAAKANHPAAVEMKEVWFRYGRELPDVLRGVTLSVPEGQFRVLLGGNGTGKSTVLRVLTGALKPYRGSVSLFGSKLKNWRDDELFRGCVAMLPQDPLSLFVTDSLKDDLAEMLSGAKLGPEQRCERIEEVAQLCEVTGLLDAHPFDLSGGEQQRAALAKVLLTEPRLLLLDEPTKGIDAVFKAQLAELLRRLTDNGVTILMVSHDVEFCARYADEASLLFDGAVVSSNPPRRFFSQNSFYTTAANRMSRGFFENAITDQDVISLCLQ